MQWLRAALYFLMLHTQRGPVLLNQIVPEIKYGSTNQCWSEKEASKEWREAGEPCLKKVVARSSTRKTIVSVFWDAQEFSWYGTCSKAFNHSCTLSRDPSWSSSRHLLEGVRIARWNTCCSFMTMLILIRRQPWNYSGSLDGIFFGICRIYRTSHPVITGCSRSWKPTLLDSTFASMKKWKQWSTDFFTTVRKTFFFVFLGGGGEIKRLVLR